MAWAVRLGGFLVVRVWKTGHDSRFDEAKHQPFKFWIYWTMQVCAFCTLQAHCCFLNTTCVCLAAACRVTTHHSPGCVLPLLLSAAVVALQAVWVYTTLLPVLLLNTSTSGGPAAVLWTDIVGGAIYATGLVTEAVADGQKFSFKMDPSNRGKFIESGLWSYARYPNYFGEMLVW